MSDLINEQAADWLDRLDELTEQEQQELHCWLAVPAHREAYQKLAAIFANSNALQQIDTALKIHAEYEQMSGSEHSDTLAAPEKSQITSNVVSIETGKDDKSQPVTSDKLPTYWLTAAASVLILVGLITLYPMFQPGPHYSPVHVASSPGASNTLPEQAALSTPVAKRQSVLLNDGSYLHLNANSQVSVNHNPAVRQATLTAGQAFFDVARDVKRPFVVEVENATITVLGTAFDVQRTASRTTIAVYEGKVSVQANTPDATKITLTRNDRLTIENGKIIRSQLRGSMAIPEWRSGWFEAQNTQLEDVIAHLQNYSARPIRLADDIRHLAISGRFHLDNANNALEMIAASHQLQVQQHQTEILLRR